MHYDTATYLKHDTLLNDRCCPKQETSFPLVYQARPVISVPRRMDNSEFLPVWGLNMDKREFKRRSESLRNAIGTPFQVSLLTNNDFRYCAACWWSWHRCRQLCWPKPLLSPLRCTLPAFDSPHWFHFEPPHHSGSTVCKEPVAQSSTWPKGSANSWKCPSTHG